MKYLLIAILTLTACTIETDPNGWETICHDQGAHKSAPYQLRWKKHERLEYLWQFDDSARYLHGDDDQYDWNKLTGLSWTLIGSHTNTAMVGWRYIEGDSVQLNAYFHIGGERWFSPPLATVAIHDPFITVIDVAGDGWVTVHAAGAEVEKHLGICCNSDRSREVWPWFGGNKPAPHRVCINRKLLLRIAQIE